MGEIEWIDPPPSSRGGKRCPSRWPGIVGELRARPGEWARVATGVNTSGASAFRNGSIVSLCPSDVAPEDRAAWVTDHLEIVTRVGERRGFGDIYMRWIGPTP